MNYSIFGESHGEEIGAVLMDFPPGMTIDESFIASELRRRAGGDELSTPRKENDNFRIISGVYNGFSTGAPICVIIPNGNVNPSDYENSSPRPNHADLAAIAKFGNFCDLRGGGHFSGRLTAPLVAIGAIVKDFLNNRQIEITSEVLTPTDAEILAAKEDGDSIGGCVEIVADGVPVGWGSYGTCGVESVLARLFFAIPAVKAVEFGAGTGFAKMRGSENVSKNGGILGGITNGEPLVARVTFKPTPSIAKEVKGRHDPCIAKRGAVVCESVMALGLGELYEKDN